MERQFDLQLSVILRAFRNLISDHQIVKSKIVKDALYTNLIRPFVSGSYEENSTGTYKSQKE
jgi:hypothetical protein